MPSVAMLPAVALVVGAAVGIAAPLPPACWLALLIMAWCGSVAGLAWRASTFTVAACVVGFVGAGAALAQRATREALEPALVAQSVPYRVDLLASAASSLEIEGDVVGDAVATEFGAAFTVDVRRVCIPHGARDPPAAREWWPSGGRVRVSVGGAQARERIGAWRAGRRIRAPVLLNAPLPYRNFGTVDQEQRLALAGLRLFGSVKSASQVEVVAHGRWWQEGSAAVRDYVRRVVARFVGSWDARSAAIVTAILIGDRAGLDAQTESRLQRAGTYHVIAISGGNIAILVTLVTMLLRLAGASPRVRAWLAIGIVLIYAAIVGSGASVARATLGAVVYLFALAIDQRSAAVNILGVAAAVIVVLAPLEVIDPAFWLTCVATLAILVCAQRLHTQLATTLATTLARIWPQPADERPPHSRSSPSTSPSPGPTPVPRWIEPPVALLSATIAAEAWLLPITAYAFSQVTLAGLALNFAAIPLMAIAQISGLVILAATASWLTPIAWTAGYLSHLAAYALVESARVVDFVPHAALRLAPPPLWLVILAECCGAACWLLPRRGSELGLSPNPSPSPALQMFEDSRANEPGPGLRLGPGPGPSPDPGPDPDPDLAPGLRRALGLASGPGLGFGFGRCRWRWHRRGRWRQLIWLAAWTCALLTILIAPPWPESPAALTALHAARRAPCAPPALPHDSPPNPATAPTPSSATPPPGWLRITSLDVAQGDATLIRLPDGETLMVDAGGSATGTYDIGARIVSPALWALGLRHLDTLVLTHGDRDHIGGAPAMLTDFHPRDVWEGIPVTGHPLLAALHQQASAQRARWRTVHLGDRPDHQREPQLQREPQPLREPQPAPHPEPEAQSRPEPQSQPGPQSQRGLQSGLAQLRVWSPPAPDWERRRVRNDDSIVLEITFGRVSVILPGDIGPDVERHLATQLEPAPLRILKAAHHGSGRSSTTTFLAALAPRIAIISAGRGNRFGHPAQATLDRYRTQGTEIFRTDQDGAIELDTNGREIFITTCSGRTLHLDAPSPTRPALPLRK
jgi:ComEC/Rec2-related protein